MSDFTFFEISLTAVLAIVLVIVLFVGTAGGIYIKETMGDRYEWLSVLNHNEWKFASEMVKEMKVKKKIRFSFLLTSTVYTDLQMLVHEGLVEEDLILQAEGGLPRTGHRLTKEGIAKRIKTSPLTSHTEKASFA